MKKYLLLLTSFFLLSFPYVRGQYNLGWDFGDTESNLYPSANLNTHLVGSVVDRQNYPGPSDFLSTSSVSTGYSGASGSFNIQVRAIHTGTVAAGTSSYIFLTLTPESGYGVTITSIKFGSRSTSTGPQAYSIRSSIDSYASDIATGSLLNNSAWALHEHTGLTLYSSSPITLRIYGYGGTGTLPLSGSNWRIDDLFFTIVSNTLPIKFADEKARSTSKGNIVQWTNMTESDIAYYSIEFSGNGKEFKEIDKINPKNNNYGPSSYSFTHNTNQFNEKCFYRIKGVEKTGTTVYSKTIVVSILSTNNSVQLYPNPVINGKTSLKIETLPRGVYQINIVNIWGQIVSRQSIIHNGGSFISTIYAPFASGRYTVQIVNGRDLRISKPLLIH